VIEFLKQLNLNIEIIFVDWPFLYGGFKPYFYCQIGSLNHCRIRFAVSGGYCLNFDIDEYLMFSKENLIEYLDETIHYPRPGSIAVSQFMVPNAALQSDGCLVRCWDFQYRMFNPGYQGLAKQWNPYGRTKYIYRFENVGYNTVHTTDSEKNDEFRKRYPTGMVVFFKIRKMIWELTKRMVRFKYPKPRIDTAYGQVSEISFLHFLGLNTDWKPAEYASVSPSSQRDETVADKRIQEIRPLVRGPVR